MKALLTWRVSGGLWALMAFGLPASGQVTVYLKNGQTLIGESILKEDDHVLELKICHSHSLAVPRSALLKYALPPATNPAPPRAATQPTPCLRLSDEELADRRRLIAGFFGAGEGDPRILAEVRRQDSVPRADVPALASAIFARAREGLKLREGDFVFDHPRYQGHVHVELQPPAGAVTTMTSSVPATAKASADAYALVLLLHGGGEGDGDWRAGAGMFTGAFRKQLGKVIFLCPTVLEKRYAEWGKNPDAEAYVKELVKAAKRTWTIDTDRVFCAGYSMGGYGTWHFGGHQADTFAGLVSGAGGILLGMRYGETWGWGILSNLAHTPICFTHARDDEPAPVWSDQVSDRILTELGQRLPGAYPHKYVEYEKGGHGAAAAGIGDAVKWVAATKRNPNPKTVVWEPSRPFIRHFHWLRVDQPRFFTRLEAAIAGNTITLKLTGLSGGFSILLNEQLVDMDKPVVVRCDGKIVFEGLVRPSLSAMLQSIEDKIDPRMWYWGRIDF